MLIEAMPALLLNDALAQQCTKATCKEHSPAQPHLEQVLPRAVLGERPVRHYTVDSGGNIQGGVIVQYLDRVELRA